MSSAVVEKPPRDRACPRCGTRVEGELLRAEHGITWLWRCACGWSGALTESGVVQRGGVREAIAQLENEGQEAEKPPPEPDAD